MSNQVFINGELTWRDTATVIGFYTLVFAACTLFRLIMGG